MEHFRGELVKMTRKFGVAQAKYCEGSYRIPLETIRTCIEQWPERLRQCIKNEEGGGNLIINISLELLLFILLK